MLTQTQKDKEDEKFAIKIKKIENKEGMGKNVITEIVKSIEPVVGDGAKEYKKKKTGGRKLLLKEEQPFVSMMSGNGKKVNPWLTHLAKVRKDNPNMKPKELMKKAKESYKK